MQTNTALFINYNTLLEDIQLLINHIYNTDFTEGRTEQLFFRFLALFHSVNFRHFSRLRSLF